MAVTTAVLSGNIADLGLDIESKYLARVVLVVEANTTGSLLLDTDGKTLLAGAKRITVDTATGAFAQTLPTTDSDDITPADDRLYKVTIIFPSGMPKAGNVTMQSGWFDLTADSALADKWTGIEVTQVSTAVYASLTALVAELEDIRTESADNLANQIDLSGIDDSDSMVSTLITNALLGPLTQAALAGKYAVIKAAPYPVTNLGVVAGTVSSAVATQNVAYINGWINTHKGTTGGAKLDFGDDEIHIYGDEVEVVNATDFDAKIHLAGRGRRATRIYQDDPTKGVVKIAATTSGNMRGVVISDLSLYKGTRAIDLDNANYCLFDNVSFMQQTEYAAIQTSSYANHFTNCWWVHQTGDAFLSSGAGSNFLHDCQIGEDAGAIILTGGALYLDGCNITGGIYDRLTPGGLLAMGSAAFTVSQYASLFIRGGFIELTHGLVNIDQCRTVRIAPERITCATFTFTAWAPSTVYALEAKRVNGDKIYQVTTAGTSAGAGGPTGTGTGITDGTVVWTYVAPAVSTLLNVRRSADAGPIELRDATIVVPASLTVPVYASHIGQDHSNVRIQNNDFRIGTSGDATFDDRLITKPELGAVLTGNTYARGVSNL